jgi:HEAT repeat protein
LTQQAALTRLGDLVRAGGGLTDREFDQFLAEVAALDPPPLAAEREAFGELARAVGVARLGAELADTDDRRLGAARLLLCEGNQVSLAAVATLVEDPMETIRHLAEAAMGLLEEGLAEPGRVAWRGEAGFDLVEEPAVSDAIAAVCAALADPDGAVRLGALSALRSMPRDELIAWATRSAREMGAAATPAASLVQALELTELAGPLLEVAGTAPDEERAPYLRALGALHLDPETLGALVSRIDPAARRGAVRVVWQVGGRAVLPFLVSLLEDSAGPVRLAVLEVFAESGDPGAARLATELLRDDSSAAVRATAVHVLARMPGEARVRGLTQALSDPDPDVRATAVESMAGSWPAEGKPGSPADPLLAALRDDDERVARAATVRLAALPDRDLPAIWSAIRDGGPQVRADILRAIEGNDPTRLAKLATVNAHATDPDERALAVDVAARAATGESTRIVVGALSDPDPTVRRAAAGAMSTIRAPSAVEALARSLSDPQADVRVEAVRALGLIDDDGVPSILIEALKDPEVMVRQNAGDALLRWRSPAVARRLASALASTDLRRPAGDVLEKMGPAAVEPLVEVVTGPDPLAAAVAGGLLGRITGPGQFVAELRSTDPATRLRAVEVVGAIGGKVASEALLVSLTDPDVRIRVRSATLLGSLGDPRSVRPLKRVFLSDPVMEVAAAAEAALRALGSHPESDVDDFGPWVADE